MPEVVINTSPLIALSSIGKIDLLSKLYSRVIVPQKVCNEILAGEKGSPGFREVKSLKWLRIHRIKNEKAYEYLLLELDEGEAETIIVAEEKGIALVVIDDYIARQIAKMRGLRVTGTLGILLKAKKKGLIKKIKPSIDRLIREGFWIDTDLYKLVLRLGKEE